MRKLIVLFALIVGLTGFNQAQDQLPVRGFCIGAPDTSHLDQFVKFIDEELASRNVNVLVLRIDYNYAFESHTELRMEGRLSKAEVKKLVEVCKKHNIRLIPQINLLGHQSWATQLGKLLQVYPEFDETPNVKIPEKYKWPNDDSLYCKSYCPLHPGVHKVVFDLVDEICDVFESDAFHAGMDEVFYIGHESCPRCAGHNKAELFANEVNLIRNHLALKNRKLWIWGDRLIDGKTTGIGEWEASMNNTYPAIDLIAKDVMICDWHYERPDPTPVSFAMKGLSVVTCPWKKADCAITQTQDMFHFRKYATPEMKDRYQGMMQTVWEGAGKFLDEFYGKKQANDESESACFKALFSEMNKVSSGK
jgi:N-acetyl-beta-hexosaminidase